MADSSGRATTSDQGLSNLGSSARQVGVIAKHSGAAAGHAYTAYERAILASGAGYLAFEAGKFVVKRKTTRMALEEFAERQGKRLVRRPGSGPAPGFLEVSDFYASSGAVKRFNTSRPTNFIFDPKSRRFVMGNGPHGHDGILRAADISPHESIVGGQIYRKDGRLLTDEWSGHYGQNWTPEIRRQFEEFMAQHGVDSTHIAWGQ